MNDPKRNQNQDDNQVSQDDQGRAGGEATQDTTDTDTKVGADTDNMENGSGAQQ